MLNFHLVFVAVDARRPRPPYRGAVSARLAVLLALLTVVGCSAPSRAAPQGFTIGSTDHALNFGALHRTYRLYLPDGLPPSAPLVVMLHGGSVVPSTPKGLTAGTNWPTARSSSSPTPMVKAGRGTRTAAVGRPGRENIDDVGFITAAVNDISANIGIDANRVYATGISNGGMMSYALACNTGIFAAIGPDSATQPDTCAAPHPTSVMHIHGTADRMIRYDGGPGAGVARIDGPLVQDLNAFWRGVDHCSPPATTTDGAVTTSTADCPENRSVVLKTVDGGGHAVGRRLRPVRCGNSSAGHPRPSA